MLDFVEIRLHVWRELYHFCSLQEIGIYIALYFESNLYTCQTHELTISEIAKEVNITDISAVYKALRRLVELGFLEKLDTTRGVLQYKFLLHTPKKPWGENNE